MPRMLRGGAGAQRDAGVVFIGKRAPISGQGGGTRGWRGSGLRSSAGSSCARAAPLELPGAKERALLAILALGLGASHPASGWRGCSGATAASPRRATASSMRWRGSGASSAGPRCEADRQAVRLDPDGIEWTWPASRRCSRQGTPEAEERALALYRGDLLDGLAVRDRGLCRLAGGRAGPAPAAGRGGSGPPAGGAGGASAARRLLALDPLREDAVRALMRHHRGRGESAQALKLFADLRDRLHRELGVRAGAGDGGARRRDPRAGARLPPARSPPDRRCRTGRRSRCWRSRT